MKYHTISRIRSANHLIGVLIVINIIIMSASIFLFFNLNSDFTLGMIASILLWVLTIIFLISLAAALSAIEEHILYLRNHIESDK